MAQTNYTPIQLYSSSTASNVPLAANLAAGELAINTNDGILFYKDSGGVVQKIGYKLRPTNAGGTGLTSFTANGVLYASSTSALATGSALTFDGTTLQHTGASNFATSSGDVGIGTNTTASLTKLTVYQTSTYGVQLMNASQNYTFRIDSGNSNAFTFGNRTSFTDLLTISTGGAVGIGYTSLTSVGNNGLAVLGNVGIGTSSPALKLDVNGSIKMSGGTGTALTWDTAIGSQYLKYDSTFNGLILAGYSGLGFRVSGATSNNMTLDSSGNLLVGQTSQGTIGSNSSFGAYSSGYIGVSSTGDSVFSRRSSNGTVITFRRDTTSVGNIDVTTVATTYNSISDYRLKNITGPVTGAKDFIMALQPKHGTWKADGSKFVGFLAHEFQEVSPSSVVGEKDAIDADGKPIMQAMQASSAEVMANLIAFVQELKAEIDSLKSQLNGA
jgi:hypothetical protein